MSILDEAHKLVHGDRQKAYGHPREDFTRTGKMWAAILGLDEVTPEQVAMCMVALKLSRECNMPKRDNRVDAAGYLETLDMVQSPAHKIQVSDLRDYIAEEGKWMTSNSSSTDS